MTQLDPIVEELEKALYKLKKWPYKQERDKWLDETIAVCNQIKQEGK